MTNKPKTMYLSARVTRDVHDAFVEKSDEYGSPSQVLRELISAFNEGRLIVNPPITNKLRGLYNE